jgi:murein L,D-transpeptidase YcbB/YkuD
MRKKLLSLFILSAVICSSCKTNTNRRLWHRSGTEQSSSEEVIARDYSVTKDNAYNDIFIDSTAFENFVTANSVNDSVAQNMRDFYNVRNFESAWFDTKGLTEQALGFRSLYKYSTDSVDRKLDQKLDDLLLHETTISASDASIVKMELQLTKRFVQFLLGGDDNIRMHDLETFVPIKKQSAMVLADSILSGKNKDNEKYAGTNPSYHGLKEQLARYVAIAKKGNWDTIPLSKNKYAVGKNFPELIALKSRLAASGELIQQQPLHLNSKPLLKITRKPMA